MGFAVSASAAKTFISRDAAIKGLTSAGEIRIRTYGYPNITIIVNLLSRTFFDFYDGSEKLAHFINS